MAPKSPTNDGDIQQVLTAEVVEFPAARVFGPEADKALASVATSLAYLSSVTTSDLTVKQALAFVLVAQQQASGQMSITSQLDEYFPLLRPLIVTDSDIIGIPGDPWLQINPTSAGEALSVTQCGMEVARGLVSLAGDAA